MAIIRQVEFGERPNEDPIGASSAPRGYIKRIWLNVAGGETAYRLEILPTPVVSFGRSSEREICVRLHPTTAPENKEKSFQISSKHLSCIYDGENIGMVDHASSNGTALTTIERLTAETWTVVKDGEQVTFAGVLTLGVRIVPRALSAPLDPALRAEIERHKADVDWLASQFVGPDKPGLLAFVHFSRINNLPEEGYVMLFGTGEIGTSARAMIRLPGNGVKPDTRRGLDLGDGLTGVCAELFWRAGALCLKAKPGAPIQVNGQLMNAEEIRALGNGDAIEIQGLSVRVEER